MPEKDLNVMLGLPAGTLPNAAVEALAKRYRGRRLYVPKRTLDETHPLAQLLGLENALRLQDAIGPGNTKEIGRLHRLDVSRMHKIVCEALSDGWSQETAAHRLGFSRRQVQRIKKAGQS
jgi:hypothetical protein